LQAVELGLAQLAAERKILEAEADQLSADRLKARRANLERDIQQLEAQWMEIGTAIEAAEASACNSGA
jgi:hypothetical protein